MFHVFLPVSDQMAAIAVLCETVLYPYQTCSYSLFVTYGSVRMVFKTNRDDAISIHIDIG